MDTVWTHVVQGSIVVPNLISLYSLDPSHTVLCSLVGWALSHLKIFTLVTFYAWNTPSPDFHVAPITKVSAQMSSSVLPSNVGHLDIPTMLPYFIFFMVYQYLELSQLLKYRFHPSLPSLTLSHTPHCKALLGMDILDGVAHFSISV